MKPRKRKYPFKWCSVCGEKIKNGIIVCQNGKSFCKDCHKPLLEKMGITEYDEEKDFEDDCDHGLEEKETRIIEFRCKECGYKNKVVAIGEWRFKN